MRTTRGGDAMLDTRGLLIKGGRLIARCPACKGDVEPSADVMKTLQQVTVLFFSNPSRVAPAKS